MYKEFKNFISKLISKYTSTQTYKYKYMKYYLKESVDVWPLLLMFCFNPCCAPCPQLSVGSPLRQRRVQQVATPITPPSASARAVASALAHLLYAGLSWTPPPASPVPKFRLTFLICSVRFTNPMLFDDKKMPYHLMLQYFVSSQGLRGKGGLCADGFSLERSSSFTFFVL